jgi:hypothetical protein
MPRFYHHGDGTNRRVRWRLVGATGGQEYSRANGQYHGVTRGGGRVDDEMLDPQVATGGQGDAEPPPERRRAAEAQEEFDRLLAAQPDEPPTPAEQAARDDNDALGDR